MSHDAAAVAHNGAHPLRPPTFEIPVGIRVLVVGAVLLAIMQGSFVAASSGFGRIWPAADSAKVVLPPANLTP